MVAKRYPLCQFSALFYSRTRLTPAFSGAVSGIQRERKNIASRPPLQRIVRRTLKPHPLISSVLPLLRNQSASLRNLRQEFHSSCRVLEQHSDGTFSHPIHANWDSFFLFVRSPVLTKMSLLS